MFGFLHIHVFRLIRMQNIEVQTSQNVKIKYRVAGVGDRILATLIDGLIIWSYVILLFYLLIEFEVNDEAFYISLILFLPAFFYHFIMELIMNGQSPGKQVLKIRVVSLDGSRPSVSSYLIRWMLRIIDILPSYGIIAILTVSFSEKAQRLGDMAAGTTVIKLNESKSLPSNPLSTVFSENHEVKYPDATLLTDQEIDIIDKTLHFYKNTGDIGPAQLLSEKLAKKLSHNLSDPPIKFLHQLKKDFHHLTSQL